MDKVYIDKMTKLYLDGSSLSEISRKLHCSVHKVVYWMQKEKIPKRTRSEAMYTKYNPNGDPFSINLPKTIQDGVLFGLGLGIYWGEGNKVSKHAVAVANSDYLVILKFVDFLTQVCSVSKDKIKYSIVSFQNVDGEEVRNYWSKMLGVSGEKFGKIVQIAPQGKGTYKNKSMHGVCTVSVFNIKLKQWILNSLQGIK